MKFQPERINLFVTTMIFLMLTLFISLGYSANQLSFILDPDNPVFTYEETRFYDGTSYKLLKYTQNDNKSAYVSIPKNSTILYSNITLKGESTPTQAFATEEVYSIAIGDAITSTPENEIAVGTYNGVDLLNSTGHNLWSDPEILPLVGVNGVAIGEVNSSIEGNEIAAATDDYNIYILRASDGSEIQKYTRTNVFNDVAIGNVTADDGNEIAAAYQDEKVYLLDNELNEIWSYPTTDSVYCVAIGDVNSTIEGNEVVAGDSNHSVYLINSSGNLIWGRYFGDAANIFDVAIGDVNTSIPGKEIAVATDNNRVYLLDADNNELWNYETGWHVVSVVIGNVTADEGDEVVIGSKDRRVYVLNSQGDLILRYGTDNTVQGVDVGDITLDPGNEVVAGSRDEQVYILNFEYYPTNVYLDVGGNGNIDWSHSSSKLREPVSVPSSSIGTEIESYLSGCALQVCDVPLVFHSDSGGDLNVTSINITYNYSASEAISKRPPFEINAWSRTNNTEVNEYIGNRSLNLSYTDPANDIEIRYVSVDISASLCDFAGKQYSAASGLCDLTSDIFYVNIGGVPPPSLLWDNSMTSDIPVWGQEGSPVTTPTGEWLKNYTVWNETFTIPAIFYNVTANITIGTEVKANEGLLVYWNGNDYELTTSSECPNYYRITIITDDFFVCKGPDSDGNNVADFFMVKQPHTSTTVYTVNGSINSQPVLNTSWIGPSASGIWGSNFNFYVNVYDYEGNNVTVGLWVHHVNSDVWEKVASKNTTDNTTEGETLQFNVTSTKYWVGDNDYKFEYQDFNGSEYIHSPENTTFPAAGPDVLKHNVSVTLVEGNDTNVIRTGLDSTTFIVNITDINWNENVSSGVNCSLWVTTDGINSKLEDSTTTNSSGFCNFVFDPDDSYTADLQWWRVGVYQDAYYNDNNSENFTVNILGELGINLTIKGQDFTRNESSILTAELTDENNNTVAAQGYDCDWYINNLPVGSSTTNVTGYCNHTWVTDCSDDLGSYLINVTLSGSGSSYYTITNNESSTNVTLKGTLNVTIILPVDNSIVYEKQDVSLNSTVTDECLTQDSYSHDVTWYSPRTDVFGSTFFWCPPPGIAEIAEGINTTWDLSNTGIYEWWYCTPRGSQVVIANATGDLYNSNEKSVSIDIWGFADVGITTSYANDTVWRNQSYDGGAIGEVKVVCEVTSNITGYGQYLAGYTVDFWEEYMGSLNYLAPVDADSNGEAIYWWNISSNITVPEGNHTIKCNISDNSALYFNTSVDEDNMTVIVLGPEDWLPPTFSSVSANSVEQYKENVTIEAEVHDYRGVDKVWVTIIYPNRTTNSTYFMDPGPPDTWSYTYNFTNLGDYDFTIFANDTTDNRNQISSWFEVYPGTVQFYGNMTDANENNVSVEFTFYRNGTDWTIYTNSTSTSNAEYNLTIRKRIYDIETRVFGHDINFSEVNITNDIANPLKFDEFSVEIPKAEKRLGVRHYFTDIPFAIESPLNFTIVSLEIDYSGVYDIYKDMDRFFEEDVRVFQCQDWNFSERSCSGEWVNIGGIPDIDSHAVSVNTTGLSGFFVGDVPDGNDGYCDSGEECPSGPYHDPNCCGGTPAPPPSDGGGGGGGGGQRRAVCGNGICEAGENSQNCPKDCGPPETLFSVRTNLTEPQINPGTEEVYAVWVTNNVDYSINTSFSVTGSITEFITFEKDSIQIDANKEEINKIYITIPGNADTGTYTGHIIVTGDGKAVTLPVTLTVSIKGATILDVLVESRNKRVGINETARFRVMLYNYGLWKRLDLNLTYFIVDPETQEVFYEENEALEITQSKTLDKRIPLSGLDISAGRYLFNVTVQYDSKSASAYDDFEVTESFWTTDRINQLLIIILIISIPIIVYFVRKRYIDWKLSKARYIFPLDFDKLPKGRIWLGKIAETNRKAFFNMKELRTHVLTAGATGSGKSVSAMIFVEELLREKVPIVVFDPTAQWSGFVRPCKDPNLLKFYKEFGMDKREVKPYRGMIYEVTDPNVKIDFDKYMNPGEITVFMLNKLKPGQYDDAVRNIIDTIFAHGWEESTKLRMVVVFDEVHRLLEKYGGKGGYISLEKACREFRKWGIGLIMASQVLSDFKEAIKGNVLTEIQLHTKSLGDLGRVEKKYGIDYAKRVTRLEVGVGMMQNPRYNKGRPWFIAFRPTLHEPHKIPDRELETYKEYAAILAKIEAKIESMEKTGQDVFDLKTEFKLAQDKLKKGRFRMAKIYIDSLRKHVLGG